MTLETYENLMRVHLKRERQAAIRADWAAVADVRKQIERLNSEMVREISPEPPGHPDNPMLA